MGRESLVFHSRISGRRGRRKGQNHQAIDEMTKAIWYTMQHAHGADMADDMHVRETLRGDRLGEELAACCVRFPRAQPASARDRTALTLVQVSGPCGWRWNKIFLCSSLNAGKKSMGFVQRRNRGKHSLTKKLLSLSHLSPFSSTPRPNNRPCVVTPGLELHSPCVRLDNCTKPSTRLTLSTLLTL